MDVLHKVVEVDAGFGGDMGWQGVVEEVHQHGLARANVAVHVEAFGNVGRDVLYDFLFLAGAEHGGEEGFGSWLEVGDVWVDDLGWVVVLEHVVEIVEVFDNTSLMLVIA